MDLVRTEFALNSPKSALPDPAQPGIVRMSHICLGCGQDMASLRAPLDRHYSLHIVTCPNCAVGHARRPVWLQRKRRIRLIKAWRMIYRQLMIGAILLVACGVLTAHLADRMREFRMSSAAALGEWIGLAARAAEPEDRWSLLAWTALFCLAGFWQSVTLRHCRTWTAGLCWIGLIGVALSVDAAMVTAAEWLADNADFLGPALGRAAKEWGLRLQTLLFGAAPLALGLGAGALVARFDVSRSSARWRARLARARKKRRRAGS